MKLNAGHKEALALFGLASTVAVASALVGSNTLHLVWTGIILYGCLVVYGILLLRNAPKNEVEESFTMSDVEKADAIEDQVVNKIYDKYMGSFTESDREDVITMLRSAYRQGREDVVICEDCHEKRAMSGGCYNCDI